MRNIILPILAVALVLLGILFYLHPISFYLHPVRSSTTTTTTTNTSLPPQIQRVIANIKFPIMAWTNTSLPPLMSINQTQTTTTQTTPVQTSTTKQQWYVQYAPEIVIAILLILLGLLYKRRSKK